MKLTLKDNLEIKNAILKKPVTIEAEWRYQQSSIDRFATERTLYFTRDLYLRNKVTGLRYKKLKDLLPRVSSSELNDMYEELFEETATTEFINEKIRDLSKRIQEKERESYFHLNVDNLFSDGWGSNEDADNEQRAIFGKKVFDYPKPTKLIKKLIASTRFKDGYVLDSFAGTGTTGQAVLELNKEDRGNRNFILVELDKKTARDITALRLKKTINGFKEAKYPNGTGQNFKYLDLDGELFDGNGFINKSVQYEDLASYVYYTETKSYLEIKTIKKPFIGSSQDTNYYLLFDGGRDNVLDEKTAKKLVHQSQAVVYADKCLVDDETLSRLAITFRQIPYELKKY